MNLSEHFTLEELTHSQIALRRGIENSPTDLHKFYLERLCNMALEPARALLGVPLRIDSGFRSPAVNQVVGGAADSAHMDGRAADFVPVGMDLQTAFDRLRADPLTHYDQIIFECRAWIHISVARLAAVPRREALTASGVPGKWHYQLVGS